MGMEHDNKQSWRNAESNDVPERYDKNCDISDTVICNNIAFSAESNAKTRWETWDTKSRCDRKLTYLECEYQRDCLRECQAHNASLFENCGYSSKQDDVAQFSNYTETEMSFCLECTDDAMF